MTTTPDQPQEPEVSIQLSGNAPLTIFPFVTPLHCEVVLRHHDGESQDIEMTPEEADQVADALRAAATIARRNKVDDTRLVVKVLCPPR